MSNAPSEIVIGTGFTRTTGGRTLDVHVRPGRPYAGTKQRIPYGALVLAFGNRAKLDMLPDVAKQSLPRKTLRANYKNRNSSLHAQHERRGGYLPWAVA